MKKVRFLISIMILLTLMPISILFLNIDWSAFINFYGPPMRPITALCFLALSGLLYARTYRKNTTTLMFSFWILFLSVSSIIYSTTELGNEFNNWFVNGLPSPITVFLFVLLSVYGMTTAIDKSSKESIETIGFIVISAGILPVFGHIFDKPILYYYFSEVTDGVSFLTAILFVVSGASILIIENEAEDSKSKGDYLG